MIPAGSMEGRSLRAGILIALVLACVDPDRCGAAAQDLLPPGPGWTVAGPAALLDPVSPLSVSPRHALRDGRPGWCLSVSRPFSVEGLEYAETAVVTGLGEGELGARWRQLGGDGLRHVELELDCRLKVTSERCPNGISASEESSRGSLISSGLWLGMGAGFQTLSGSGMPRYGAGVFHMALAVQWKVEWRAAVAYRGGFGSHAGWVRPGLEGAVGRFNEKLAVLAGWSCQRAGDFIPALSLSFRGRRVRFDAGVWGVPVAPAAGIHLVVKELRWSVEGRWVPDLGLQLLWSVASPRFGGQ